MTRKAGPVVKRSIKKYRCKEDICRILYQQKARQPFKKRRDGKEYKSWWLTKGQTNWLEKAPAKNGGFFYRVDARRDGKAWEGVFKYEDLTLLVKVTIAPRGSSYMVVTKEG